jgi:hypothetical protein
LRTATTTKATQLMSAIEAPMKFLKLTFKMLAPLMATPKTTTKPRWTPP